MQGKDLLLGNAGCLGGGVLPKIIEQWMREELGPVVGPRNPLMLKREMPLENTEEKLTRMTHAEMEGFMGLWRNQRRRRHLHRASDAATDGNIKT